MMSVVQKTRRSTCKDKTWAVSELELSGASAVVDLTQRAHSDPMRKYPIQFEIKGYIPYQNHAYSYFKFFSRDRDDDKCYNCNRTGHYARDCRSYRRERRSRSRSPRGHKGEKRRDSRSRSRSPRRERRSDRRERSRSPRRRDRRAGSRERNYRSRSKEDSRDRKPRGDDFDRERSPAADRGK